MESQYCQYIQHFNDNETFCNSTVTPGHYIKQPRGPITPKYISKYQKYFMLYFNNGNPNFNSRNPLWLTVGDIYNTLGFSKITQSKPSYFYTFDYLNIYNRINFQKHKLNNLLENSSMLHFL